MITFVIFARGGSKGLVDKNLRYAGGRTLLQQAISHAKSLDICQEIWVSTDSVKIAEAASFEGAKVIQCPGSLATDDSPEWLSWQHAIKFLRRSGYRVDVLVSIPTTAPLRNASDIERCIDLVTNSEDYDAAVTVTQSRRSPWFNMVEFGRNGKQVSLIMNADAGISRRQDAPLSFDMTTVAYALKAEFVLSAENLWQGKIGGVIVPEERALDIDTEFDLKIADHVLSLKSRGCDGDV